MSATFQPVRADRIEPQALRWLWHDRIPLGKVTILAGDGGLGKSTLMVELAARLSRGELDGDLRGAPAPSYLLSVEDDARSTIVPRLMAAEADLALVHVMDGDGARLGTLPADKDALEEAVRSLGVRLLVLDPLGAFISERINTWNDQQVRRAMAPLGELAQATDCAIVAIMHLNRRESTSTSSRFSGSPAFRNAARSALVFGPDPSDPEGPRRVLAQEKANLTGPGVRSLLCRIESAEVTSGDRPLTTSRIRLLGDSTATAANVLTGERDDRPEVVRWLEALLRDGPCLAADVDARARERGFSPQNVKTARKHLRVQTRKLSDGRWQLSLPQPLAV